MKKVLKQFAHKTFLKFLLVSGIAALANFFSRMVFGLWMSYGWSIVAAYIVGIITAYLLCRRYVFTPQKNTALKQMLYFTLVNGFAILLTLVVSLGLEKYILLFIHDRFLREEVAHFIGICAPAFTSYLGHKYFSFK